MRTSEKHLLLLLENFICKWGRLLELLQPQKIIKSKLNWIPCLIPQNYRDILKTAVTSNASALKYASDDLQNDRDIILTVIESDTSALQYASDDLKNDRHIVLTAIEYDASALHYASDDFRSDPIGLPCTTPHMIFKMIEVLYGMLLKPMGMLCTTRQESFKIIEIL